MTFYDKKNFPHSPKLSMASENFPKIRLFHKQYIQIYIPTYIYICIHTHTHTHTHIQSTNEQRSPKKELE